MTNKQKAEILYKLLNDPTIPDAPDLTDEEWAGLCEEAPMTFELYISCLEKCAEGNCCEFYFEVLEQFPEYLEQYDDYLERVHGIKKMSPEDVDAKWLEFKAKYINGDS